MDDIPTNPGFQGYVQTPSAMHLPAHTQSAKPKPAPPQVKRIILELSLRYQPTDEVKRGAFNDKVALLAMDCANVPVQWLDAAAREWITSGDAYLPTASWLIKSAQQFQNKSNVISLDDRRKASQPGPDLRDFASKQDLHNATLAKLWDRRIPEHELAHIPERTFRSAVAQGSCLVMRNGARRYRTAETVGG